MKNCRLRIILNGVSLVISSTDFSKNWMFLYGDMPIHILDSPPLWRIIGAKDNATNS
jgi:hypothetical protein